MRVLILSCNTGQGHNSVSAAIGEYLQDRGVCCHRQDALSFVSEHLSQFISKGHDYMYRHIPRLVDWGYGFAEKHTGLLEEDGRIYKLFARGAEKLWEYCKNESYDVILCPHVFSAMLVSEMQRQFGKTAQVYFIATDYTCSPGAAAGKLDGWFIPDESLKQEFMDQGIPEDWLFGVGIPIRQCFFDRLPKEKAKTELGIAPEQKHLVMSCGSMGCGPMEELTDLISRNLTENQVMTVICGTNEKLRERLQEDFGERKGLRIVGYCKDMGLMMDSADVFLTKPGGISVTEAAAKGLPMVLVNAVSGCEEYNLRFFTERGMALTADTSQDLAELALRLLEDQPAQNRMRENMACLGNRNGAKGIWTCLQQ